MTQHDQPLLIYDGDCSFCLYCVEYARIATASAVDYQPYQTVQDQFPDISEEEFRTSIQLVVSQDEIITGANAAFTVLSHGGNGFWVSCYQHVPLFGWASEKAYQFVARHRSACLSVSRFLFGPTLQPQELSLTISVFLRALALIYLFAFFSFANQALGLIGSNGILPVTDYLSAVDQHYGAEKFWLLPTLFWLISSDFVIQATVWSGVFVSIMLLFNVLPTLSLCVLYGLYLSLLGGGQVFMSYQWDILLLECGFLAIFLRAWPGLFTWLFRWLLFRFMLQSGLVKLLSGDPNWHQLSALHYHFESQPLPTALAWYADKLPDAILQTGVVLTFVVELLLPFLILMPRRPRLLAAVAIVLFELMIIATGNYNFFNLLTMALCILLLDDRSIKPVVPKLLRLSKSIASATHWRKPVLVSIAMVYTLQSCLLLSATGGQRGLSEASRTFLSWTAPLHLVNGYGLFAVMTTGRPEIVIEGSQDGDEWLEYELPYKPGSLHDKPAWATPHQPRLDWQLWFAALAPAHRNPWLESLMFGLLSNSEPVLQLFEVNPFPTAAPKYVRAQLYQYRFTSFAEREKSSAWWHRESASIFIQPMTLRVLPGGS